MADLTTPLTPTTDLEAVNVLLSCIGERPVTTLLDTGLSDVDSAMLKLRETLRNVQIRPRSWNTNTDITLARDGTGKIAVPSNTLMIEPSRNEYRTFTARGGYLYNTVDNTNIWTSDVRANVVLGMIFSDLPEHARDYIVWSAAMRFQAHEFASQYIMQMTQAQYARALRTFRSVENRTTRKNLFYDTPTGISDAIRAPITAGIMLY